MSIVKPDSLDSLDSPKEILKHPSMNLYWIAFETGGLITSGIFIGCLYPFPEYVCLTKGYASIISRHFFVYMNLHTN
jgi:hypothetical protein